MKEYLSVKEFSRLSGIEQTTLRYWDDIGLFSPAKRDPDNNYRYYSPQQIIAVNFITVLSELNIPLKTIGELERERTPEKIVALIESQERRLDMEMRKLREAYSIIHTRRELINYGIRLEEGFHVSGGLRVEDGAHNEDSVWVDEKEIAILKREERAYIRGPRNEWPEDGSFYEPFVNFCNSADELRLNLNFPVGGLHDSFEIFQERPGQPDYFFSLDPTGNRKRPAGKYMIGFYRGYYGMFGDVAERMAAYAEKNKVHISGPVLTTYLLDEVCLKNPEYYMVQVAVAIT